ncbi:hypothetical protein P43SY_006402 [Pythium insidiosum]|uniref:BZIP domain-containing protein n=1 Tax=Pythium insidiosum TaxID=114742 RepID=A0AAD5LXJ3_PYTIN|nr:hypothetical protein P43SY_006402 [Pythium insidiosum]
MTKQTKQQQRPEKDTAALAPRTMRLSFILNDPEVTDGIHHEEHKHQDEDDAIPQMRYSTVRHYCFPLGHENHRFVGSAERARYLQNLRQRRYRARKKLTLTALQRESQALFASNRQLESEVLAQLDALVHADAQQPTRPPPPLPMAQPGE